MSAASAYFTVFGLIAFCSVLIVIYDLVTSRYSRNAHK